MIALLTPEQKVVVEKLIAGVEALRANRLESERIQSQRRQLEQPQGLVPGYLPGPGSWQPGLPLPSGVVLPSSPQKSIFPRKDSQ